MYWNVLYFVLYTCMVTDKHTSVFSAVQYSYECVCRWRIWSGVGSTWQWRTTRLCTSIHPRVWTISPSGCCTTSSCSLLRTTSVPALKSALNGTWSFFMIALFILSILSLILRRFIPIWTERRSSSDRSFYKGAR